MIDTCMVLWNQGARHKGIRVLFTLLFGGISLFLLLMTSILPGWILLMHNTDTMKVTASTDSTLITSVQSGSTMITIVTPTQVPLIKGTFSAVCVMPTAKLLKAQHISVNHLSPSHTSLASKQHPFSGIFLETHTLYSGRSSGAISHLHLSLPNAATPTVLPTRTPLPYRTPSPVPSFPSHNMHPHIVRTDVPSPSLRKQDEIMRTPLANPSIVQKNQVDGSLLTNCN